VKVKIVAEATEEAPAAEPATETAE
jgi:hypothetical protein